MTDRERFIPLRKADLVAVCAADDRLPEGDLKLDGIWDPLEVWTADCVVSGPHERQVKGL